MAIKLLEELDDLEKLSLIDLSYSRIETFLGSWGCPAKYFFSYIQGEESQFGAPATLGNIVHKALEEQVQPNEKIDLDKLLDEYALQIPKWDPDNKVGQDLIDAGKQMLTEFVDRHDHETFPIVGKEQYFEIVVGTGLIRGMIDRVDFDGKVVRITDYKSGKNEVTAKDTPTNLQLGIYALAMKKIYPDYPIHASLYYLKSGKQKGHLFSDDDLDAVELKLTKIVNMIVNSQNFGTTSNARICYYCDHAASGVCGTGVFRIRKRQR
jgi:DNA helicase-2/ATP-dependent DNA helicase PcrA